MIIQNLITDIYSTVGKKDGWFTTDIANEFSAQVAQRLVTQYEHSPRRRGLRLSAMGPKCPRALWFSINDPGLAESLPPWANIKYSFGHIIEAQAIAFAKAAGHLVTGEQDEVTVDGITGHRDCVIDGCIVDVKSSSSFGFKKFQDGSIAQADSFGYLDQLDGYLVGSADDPLVTVKDRAYLLAIDKQLGHMCLYEHRLREGSIRKRISEYKQIVASGSPPPCQCGTVPDGRSGNIKLDTKASYNVFKHSCFPSLRTFIYSSGPVYLTKVVRLPDVKEVDKLGRTVYN